MKRNNLLTQALGLPVDERIQLVEDVWESIAELPEAIDVTDEQREELDRRLVARAKGEWRGSPWEAVKARILRGRDADTLGAGNCARDRRISVETRTAGYIDVFARKPHSHGVPPRPAARGP